MMTFTHFLVTLCSVKLLDCVHLCSKSHGLGHIWNTCLNKDLIHCKITHTAVLSIIIHSRFKDKPAESLISVDQVQRHCAWQTTRHIKCQFELLEHSYTDLSRFRRVSFCHYMLFIKLAGHYHISDRKAQVTLTIRKTFAYTEL